MCVCACVHKTNSNSGNVEYRGIIVCQTILSQQSTCENYNYDWKIDLSAMTHTHTHIRMSSRCRYQQSHTYPMPWWWYVWWRARNNEPKIEETAHRVDGNIYQPNCEVEFYGKNFWCKYAHVGKIKTFISNFNSFYGCVGVHLGAGMQPYHRNVMAIMIQINGLCAHVFVSRQSVWPIYVWYNIL